MTQEPQLVQSKSSRDVIQFGVRRLTILAIKAFGIQYVTFGLLKVSNTQAVLF